MSKVSKVSSSEAAFEINANEKVMQPSKRMDVNSKFSKQFKVFLSTTSLKILKVLLREH